MPQMRKNFRSEETECHCGCGSWEMTEEFWDAIQELRDLIGRPIFVMSGHRCVDHNKKSGAKASFHLPRKDGKIQKGGKACAADIQVSSMRPAEVKEFALQVEAFRDGGIGYYAPGSRYGAGWVHVDTRGYKARWNKP